MGIGHAGLKLSSSLKLKVGGRYKNNRGYEIFIVSRTGSLKYPFVSACGFTYSEDGKFDLDDSQSYEDLIEEVIDIASGPKIKLEVGKTYYTRDGRLAYCVRRDSRGSTVFPYTVMVAGSWLLYTENGRYTASDHRWDLVLEVIPSEQTTMTKDKTELEILVEKANEGLTALSHLKNNYSKEIDWFSDGKKIDVYDSGEDLTIQVKQKPKFEHFSVGGRYDWSVFLDGDNLHIGCETFCAKALREGLNAMVRDDCSSFSFLTMNNAAMFCTKNGIDYGRYKLSWADATKILEALEKAGV